MPINKIICPGTITYGRRPSRVFVRIAYSDNGNLSLTGVIGPTVGGNAAGSCGQIVDELANITRLYPQWTQPMLDRLTAVWCEWHLNDTNSGSPAQMAHLKSMRDTPEEPKSFKEATAALIAAGLYDDEGCWYDSKARKVVTDVPESAVEVWENYKALRGIVAAQAAAYSNKAKVYAKEAADMLEIIQAHDSARKIKRKDTCDLAQRAFKSLSAIGGTKWIPGSVLTVVQQRITQLTSSEAFSLLLSMTKLDVPLPEYKLTDYFASPPSLWNGVGAGFRRALLRTHNNLQDLERMRYDLTYTQGRKLLFDGCRPYRYGSAYMRTEVPDDVLEFLMELPASAFTPAWV